MQIKKKKEKKKKTLCGSQQISHMSWVLLNYDSSCLVLTLIDVQGMGLGQLWWLSLEAQSAVLYTCFLLLTKNVSPLK